jgi:AcrR family transcriptional regulator
MSQAASPSRTFAPRQKRAMATRGALLEAVERIVAAEGPDAVTTTRLAGDTGVAVGTIYRYFADRDALLLAAYDATVLRIVADCRQVMEELPAHMHPREAANVLLRRYLDAAEAIPAHSGLLRAMRAIRPIEADQSGSTEVDIIGRLIAPALERFIPGAAGVDPDRLRFMNVLIGTMVDFYLVAPDGRSRERIAREIEAHVGLMVERLAG